MGDKERAHCRIAGNCDMVYSEDLTKYYIAGKMYVLWQECKICDLIALSSDAVIYIYRDDYLVNI